MTRAALPADSTLRGLRRITLQINARYFDIFETQGFHPEPAEEASAGE